jgi:ATP-dependent DNA helicase RecG
MHPLLTEEAQLKLADLKLAVPLERKHQFVDVQGKKQRFSAFVCQSLKVLNREFSGANAEVAPLLNRFERYGMSDLTFRMAACDALETFVLDALNPKRKTAVTRATASNSATAPPENTPLHELEVQYIKGVGPRLASILGLLNIATVQDLLHYFPRDYVDYNQQASINTLLEGDTVSIIATVESATHHELKNRQGLQVLRLKVSDKSGVATASWFFGKKQLAQLHAFKNKFPKSTQVLLSGKVKWDSYSRCPSLEKAEIQSLSYEEKADATDGLAELPQPSLHTGRIVPIYPLSQGVNLKTLRKCIYQALTVYSDRVEEYLPAKIRQNLQLLPLQDALMGIHFPETMQQCHNAKRRLIFDELFLMQLRLGLLRQQYKQNVQGLVLTKKADSLSQQFLEHLPFQLTNAQNRAFGEICADLSSSEPMNRLLHGDVGAGKTVVAALALLVAVENGYQAALMAPTEILAEQHYKKFVDWFTPLGIGCALVLGKQSAKTKRAVKQGLLNGQLQVAVGTHALIQDDVEFQRLGVVVVDEQHRFGVRQRMKLRDKGEMPELLSMTATPIPRTLAMTVHGDLDVSVLDELPPGRSPIKTVMLSQAQRVQTYDLIRQQVGLGRQVYIVFPLIEESETLSAKAATAEIEKLQKEVFPTLKLGLLHGKLKSEEKEAVMGQFASGELHILVATTVVEVGVDVPNATVMMIESADRFGLAQLHQLRGRVGRGKHQSYCLLLSTSKNSETKERLAIMEQTTDGFVIAEHDLSLRGPGDYLGTRQSGLPDLALADLVEDHELLALAREQAFALLAEPLGIDGYPALKQTLFRQMAQGASLLNSG